MRRRIAPLGLVLVLLGSACGDGAVDETTSSTTTVATTTTTAEPTTTISGRPIAPDFTLQLGDGGSYTLSEGARPVYLVFWAEW
jgi:hypothetical protein